MPGRQAEVVAYDIHARRTGVRSACTGTGTSLWTLSINPGDSDSARTRHPSSTPESAPHALGAAACLWTTGRRDSPKVFVRGTSAAHRGAHRVPPGAADRL